MSSDESDTSSEPSIHRHRSRRPRRLREPPKRRSRSRGRSERRSSGSKHSRRRRSTESSSDSSSTSRSTSRNQNSEDSEESEDETEYSHESSSTNRNVFIVVLVVFTVGGLLFALSAAKSKTRPNPSTTTGTSSQSPEAPQFPSNDFLSSLAASYSMTPAKVTDLPAPTAPLPSSTTAEFIKSNWPAAKAKASEFVEFVEDPLESSGDIVLSVMYPKGQYTAGEEGGTHMSLDVFGEGKTRAMLTYQVGFESNFDFVKGGKLPGLFGGDHSGKCGGGKGSEACFSARFMWREEGEGEVYTYVPLYDGLCDENKANESSVACHGDFGQSFNRGSFKFSAGQYTTLTEIAILNSDPSKDTEANGYLAVYDGETLAFERSDLVYRTNASVFFSSIMFQTFFGGSTPDYASSVLTHTYYKNWRFFEGEEASTTEGKQVAASVGE